MKIKLFILFSMLSFQINYSQKTVKMVVEYGSKSEDLNSLMSFQNIEVENLSFESPEIVGKYYEVNLKEYKKGKLVSSKNLIDLKLVDYLKIDSTYTSFKFFSKIENDKMTVLVETPTMSCKQTFKLQKGNGEYVLKDFQGINKFADVPLNEEFPILAIITPVKLEDGYSSYCEVAQSGVAPERFWEKFKIPHYFVITMKFK